jgi:hypothetical protein
LPQPQIEDYSQITVDQISPLREPPLEKTVVSSWVRASARP